VVADLVLLDILRDDRQRRPRGAHHDNIRGSSVRGRNAAEILTLLAP
jgi:hypothetical protein